VTPRGGEAFLLFGGLRGGVDAGKEASRRVILLSREKEEEGTADLSPEEEKKKTRGHLIVE